MVGDCVDRIVVVECVFVVEIEIGVCFVFDLVIVGEFVVIKEVGCIEYEVL